MSRCRRMCRRTEPPTSAALSGRSLQILSFLWGICRLMLTALRLPTCFNKPEVWRRLRLVKLVVIGGSQKIKLEMNFLRFSIPKLQCHRACCVYILTFLKVCGGLNESYVELKSFVNSQEKLYQMAS
ncbi:uncharacterized protein LOC131002313 [Salvia miltiorrhiza]|uniref:uncharacterized protein LOC131002313 n=1 Tax=Salvia miltiorrhiza TaxID=226208 RepID=UPI0025AB85E0|nr:uncharacterized protein LOC131002313 [Salvia miltiorrhiza]